MLLERILAKNTVSSCFYKESLPTCGLVMLLEGQPAKTLLILKGKASNTPVRKDQRGGGGQTIETKDNGLATRKGAPWAGEIFPT